MKKTFMTMVCAAGLVMSASAAEKAAFLGVGASPLSPDVAIHVGLPNGVGLLVNAVSPEGPAKGQLEAQDILHKMDDQILVSPEQLSVLVRSHKPGDEVKVALIRCGERKNVTVKLGETTVQPQPQVGISPLMPNGPVMVRPNVQVWRGGQPMPGGNPAIGQNIEEQIQQLHEMMKQLGVGPEEMQALLEPEAAPEAGAAPAEPKAEAKQPAHPRAAKPVKPMPAQEMNKMNTQIQQSMSSSITQMENGVSVTIQTQNDQRTVKIEKDGQEVYQGSLNSDEDLQAVPEAYREQVQKMRDSVHMQFRHLPGPPPARIHGPVI